MTGQPSDCVQKPLQRATDEHSERVESDADLCPHDGQQEEQGEDEQDAVSLRPSQPNCERPWQQPNRDASAVQGRQWQHVENREHEVENDRLDRKSTRLNSSHMSISYAVFC